jgi:hypothetical protein
MHNDIVGIVAHLLTEGDDASLASESLRALMWTLAQRSTGTASQLQSDTTARSHAAQHQLAHTSWAYKPDRYTKPEMIVACFLGVRR